MDSDDVNNRAQNNLAVETTVTKFWWILRKGASQVMNDAPKAWKGPNAHEYEYEQDILKRNYSCIRWGIYCSFACFVSFRLGANPRVRQFRERLIAQWRMKQNSNAETSKPASQLTKEWKSPAEIQDELLRARLQQASSVPVDLLVSFFMGISATAFLADFKQMDRDFQQIPLVYGRSVVSDVLCHDMTEAYENASPQVWQNGPDDRLATMHTFVKNCRTRSTYETMIRQQSELPDAAPVSIPYGAFNKGFLDFLESIEARSQKP